MKISRYRDIGVSYLILSLFVSIVLIGCSDDTFPFKQNSNIEEGNFKIRINAAGATSSTLSSSDDDAGTEDENYINFEGQDYKIYIFDINGNCHDEIQMNYSAGESNPAAGSYCLTGNLPLADEDLREIQVVCLANTKEWMEDPVVDNIEDFSSQELVFDYKKRISEAPDGKRYSWQPNKVAHDGIPMAGVSEKKIMDRDPDAINTININLVRALSKFEVLNSDLYNNGNSRMYVKKTGCSWVEVYLYAWQNGSPDEILGRWPGSAPTGVMTINEAEYYYWDLGENNGTTQNFIFNNNNKGIQMDGPQNVVLNRDFYVEIVDNDNWTVSKEFVHDGYTVFINKKYIDLDNVYLYIWGDNEIMGPWPGRTPTGIRKFGDSPNEKYYYFWDLGTEYEGKKVHFEFSGGSDATKLPVINEDFTIHNGQHTFFFLDYQSGGVKVEKSTITVTKPEGWNQLFVYEYNKSSNEKIFGEWPGSPMPTIGNKIIVDGKNKEFYQIEISGELPDGRSKVGLDAYLLFNDGHGRQLSDHHYNTKDNLFLNLSESYFNVDLIDNEAQHYKHRVYVKDPGWENLYVYNWGVVGEIFGKWPGMKLDIKENIEGVDYYMFDINPKSLEDGLEFNLIFNNNAGTQTDDYHLEAENYFLEIIDNTVQIEEQHQNRTGINQEGEKYYKVFVNNDGSTWGDNIYLYMWGDINDLGGGWPGMKPNGKTTIQIEDDSDVGYTEKEYYYFDLEPSWTGLNENIILNSVSVQMADYNFTINGDLYISMREGITDISDHQVEPDVVNIYVKDNINWDEGLYLYAFGGDTGELQGWPGQKGVETADGYKFTINGCFGKSTTLIFNNGGKGSQLDNFEAKLNGDLYLCIGVEDKKLEKTNENLVVETPSSPDNINSIGLLEYNTTGLLLPRLDLSQSGVGNWWSPTNYRVPKLPEGVKTNTNREEEPEEDYNLYFVQTKTPGKWVCYVPEWEYRRDSDNTLLNSGLNLRFNIKNYHGSIPQVENQYKEEDGNAIIIAPVKMSGEDEAFGTFLRNNLYQAKVNINTNFDIIYTICEWIKQTSGDIEFK